MNDTDALQDLLLRWQELRDKGAEPTAEDLCADRPDLAPALRGRIQEARAMKSILNWETQLPTSANLGARMSEEKTTPDATPNQAWSTPSGSKVRCPQCHNPIQLGTESDEVLCPGCGSSFRLRDAKYTETTSGMKQMGKFQLLERLGLGGFGAVWKARDTELDRIVALKIPHTGLMTEREELERFQREARAAANLRHPNIVCVHEVATLDGLPAIVAEFVPGVPLKDLLEVRRLTFRQSAAFIVEVADALEYAHSLGVVHRDVKPANIMILREAPASTLGSASANSAEPTSRNKGELAGIGKPMLLDFGLALRDAVETTMTVDGHVLGTPAYMSPEQAAGLSHKADRRSDVYSLGVVLYQMLTGELPFRGSRSMMMHQVLHEEVPAPRKINDKIPRDLETICLKCLAKVPAGRYVSARELADDLRRYLADESIVARPVGTAERLWRWCRRKPALAASSGLAAFGLVLALGTFAGAFFLVNGALDKETIERKKAQKLADDNKLLAQKEGIAREQAETLALRVQFDHYFSKAENRPDLAQVGMASLLPTAARFKKQAAADLLRLHVGAWRGRAARLSAIWPHQQMVVAVALSGDGKTALTGSFDMTARLWETATGKPIGPPLQHHGQAVLAVALSANGTTALTGSQDKTARVWDTATGKPIGPPLQHQDSVVAVALSADGKMALTGSWDKTARLWETATGKPIGPPLQHQRLVRAVALSPDGKTALTGSWDQTARLWETATGKPIGPPLQHQDKVVTVALSADGKRALTGSWDKTARVWEMPTGKPIGPPLQHQDKVNAVALSADGQTALTGSQDKTAKLWDTATGKPIGPPLQHQGGVISVALSADCKTAVTGSSDETARLWETVTGKAIGPPLPHQGPVYAVALSAAGMTALTGSQDNTARLWETASSEPAGPPLQHQVRVVAVALSADGKTALTGSNNTARLWEMATGKAIGPPLQHQDSVVAAALSADGKMALTGSWDRTARLWETATGKAIGPPLQHQDSVVAVALSADGKMALTGSWDRTARLWETATGKAIGPPLQHQDSVVAVALSADGKMALTGSNNTARLWETATGKAIGPPLQHQDSVVAVALSADGKMALTGSTKTAQLWETATGKPIGPPLQHQDKFVAVALSADAKTALTGSTKTAQLWETATGKPIGPPLQHQDKVNAVALSADGQTALTGSNNTARLWKVPQPIRGDPERIMLWTQVITGLEVDELTAVRVLDAATWQQRRQRLQDLGGPPEQ